MSIEELLRSLIDKLDSIEGSGSTPQPVVVHVHNNMNGQTSTDVSSDDETGPFTPPLQQKIELLKKSAGLKSFVFTPKIFHGSLESKKFPFFWIWSFKIAIRVCFGGYVNPKIRSKRPERTKAGSKLERKFVVPMIKKPSLTVLFGKETFTLVNLW